VLSEEELLKILVEAKRVGPYQFERQAWPLLKNKMITYCDQIDDVKTAGTDSLLILKVNKRYAGEKLPWLLEGKTAAPDAARLPKPGETICMTGTIESYTERNNSYWGHVKVVSVEKSAAS